MDGVKDLVGGPQIFFPGQGVVAPVHHHFAAAHVIGGPGAQAGEPRLVHGAVDGQQLALLQIQPLRQQQPGIIFLLFAQCFHQGSLRF